MTTAICIYGLPGSGKSTFVDVANEYGLETIIMGDVVRSKAHTMIDEPVTGQKIGEWATNQREQHGKEIMAEYTVERINDTDAEFAVIEGVRSQAELRVFNETMTVERVYVHCPFDQRLERLQNRNDDRADLSENGVTRSELQKRDEREKQWGMGELIEKTDTATVITNTGTLTEYKTEINNYLQELLS